MAPAYVNSVNQALTNPSKRHKVCARTVKGSQTNGCTAVCASSIGASLPFGWGNGTLSHGRVCNLSLSGVEVVRVGRDDDVEWVDGIGLVANDEADIDLSGVTGDSPYLIFYVEDCSGQVLVYSVYQGRGK